MRRRTAVVCLLVLCLSLAVGGGAQAREPLRFSDHRISLSCDFINNDSGALLLFVEASEAFGGFAELAFWPNDREPFEDPPALVADFEAGPTISATDASITAQIPLANLAGDPQGVASVSATLTPLGDPEPLEDERQGNRWIRQEGTIQQMAVSGTATLPEDNVFSLNDCSATIIDVVAFETDPNTFVERRSGQFVECAVETESAFIIVSASSPGDGFVVLDSATEGLLIGDGPVRLTRQELSGTIPLHEESPEGDVVGEAVIDATLTATERVNVSTESQTRRNKQIATLFDVSGTLTILPDGEEIALDPENCFAIDFHDSFTQHNPRGPKPGGKPPINDSPQSALPLSIGSHLTQQTGGAAEAPEEECVIEEEFSVPLGRTVWYSVVGTGGPITVDTDGSNFDTVIGVYTDGLDPIACVDDVQAPPIGFSLQSVVTLEDTIPGTTYLVQIGGFAAEFGTLKVAVS